MVEAVVTHGHPVRRNLAAFVAVGVLYYVVPVSRPDGDLGTLAGTLGLVLLATVVLGWLITRQVRQQLLAPRDSTVRVQSLLVLVYIVVAVFALGYYVLERNVPGQFDELSTRTDALYFTVATLATVGYGDVHAVGQAARGVVTVQMFFNLVFVGALVTVLRRRVGARVDHQSADRTVPPSPP